MGRLCTNRNGNNVIPMTVFKPSTVVLAYNGIHFWCTKIGNPGSSDMASWLENCKKKVPKRHRWDVQELLGPEPSEVCVCLIMVWHD
jgi:hypothetical protein